MAILESSNWSVGARSETGYVRLENQDRMAWIRAPIGDLFIVSDGAGGHAGGGVAATMTADILQHELTTLDGAPNSESVVLQITHAFAAANEAVYRRAHSGDAATRLMCATAVLVIVTPSRMMVAHVGDSRAYLYTRPQKLRQLTKDHSQVQRLLDEGRITPEQAVDHPSSSVLERAIGYQRTVTVDISDWLPLSPDETILLCSDGLSGYVSDKHIAEVLAHTIATQTLADQLVALALAQGGEDNVTVQVIRYGRRQEHAKNWHAPLGILCLLGGIAAVAAGLSSRTQPAAPVLTTSKTAGAPLLQSSIPTPAAPSVVAAASAPPDSNSSPNSSAAVADNTRAASSTQASAAASIPPSTQASKPASKPAPPHAVAKSRHSAKASALSASAPAHENHIRHHARTASAVSAASNGVPDKPHE